MTRQIRGVVVSDLHVGSHFALADLDDDEVPRGGPGKQTREALFDRWRGATKGEYGEPDVLIVNGDAIDGPNRKKSGIGTWSTDLLMQSDNAVSLLKMWKARQVFVIRGSGYHVEANHSGLQCEEYIARQLGAVEVPGQEHIKPERRERSGWEWYIHLGEITAHCSHKISVSKVFHYQTTPTARQMLQAKLNDRLRHEIDLYRTRILIRSHAHYFNHIEFSGSKGYVTPCWKALDEFMLANGPLDISPDIGFLPFVVTEGGGFRHDTIKGKTLWSITEVQQAPFCKVPFRNPRRSK